jgi:hypothetical protein
MVKHSSHAASIPRGTAVDPIALTSGIALSALLIAIAVYFAIRQRQTMVALRSDVGLSREDRHYLHRQAVRRLFNSALLVVLALMLLGGLFLEANLNALHPEEPIAEPGAPLPENVKESLHLLAGYWIITMMVFLAVMLVAVLDLVATARYAAQQRRQLVDDRRDALAEDVERIRRDRHGLNGGL